MKGEVRKRVEREFGNVNRMMSIRRFLENKGRMLQGGRGISFSWECQHTAVNGKLSSKYSAVE